MAKKRIELDEFGFSNSLDMPEFNFGAPKIKDDRNAATKIAGSVMKGAKERAMSPSFIRRFIQDAMPKGFSDAASLVNDTTGTLKNLYNDAGKDTKPVIRDMKRATKRLMPQAEAALPKVIANKIKKWAESEDEHQSQSDGQRREMSLQAQMSEIFQYQTKSQLQKDAENDARANIKEGIDHLRHGSMLGQLDAMRVSLQQLANYQVKVDANFQRKSLELQFRHYFVAMDSLAEQKRNNVVVQANLEGILKNSGLPDFVKMKSTETLKQLMRNKFMDGVADNMFGRRKDLIRNLGANLATAARNKIKSFTGDVAAGLNGAASASDALRESGGVGGLAGDVAVDSFGKRMGAKIRNKFGQNERITNAANKAQMIAGNTPQLLMDYARGNKHETGGKFDWLVRGFKNAILQTGNPDDTLDASSKDTAGSLLSPQPMTRGTNKAITEIIPGFLSRIYRELRIMRTGNDKEQLVSYDYTSNKFAEKSVVAKNAFKSVVKDGDKAQTTDQINKLIDKIDPTGKLDPEQRKLLGQQLLRDNMKMMTGNKARFTSAQSYTGGAGRHSSKFANVFGDYFAGDVSGRKEAAFNSDYNDLGRNIKETRKNIQDHVNAGNREHLEAAGILSPGSENINMDKVYEYYYGGEDFNPTGPNSKRRRRNLRGNMNGPRGNNDGLNAPIPPMPTVTPAPQTTPNPSPIPGPIGPLPSTQATRNARPSTPNSNAGLDSRRLIEAVRASSSRTIAESIQETLKRIEEQLKQGVPSIPSGEEGQPASRRGFWNRSIGSVGMSGVKVLRGGLNLARGAADTLVGGTARTMWAGVKGSFGLLGKGLDKLSGLKDVYLQNEVVPRLLAAKMKMGLYRDQATGKVIRKAKDIKGAVVDEVGNVVMTAEEASQAFVRDGVGKKLITVLGATLSSATEIAKGLGNAAFASAGIFYHTAFKIATGAFGQLSQPQDVYVKGKDEPVLLKRTMIAGGYRSKITGRVIKHPGDIDGIVLDEDGNVVLTREEFKAGIFNSRGKPIRTGISKIIGLGADVAKTVIGGAINAGHWLKDKVMGGFEGIGSTFKNIFTGKGLVLAGGKVMNDRLTEIRDLLRDRLPKRKKDILGDRDGDGERDGDYSDWLKRQKSGNEDVGNSDPSKPGSGGKAATGFSVLGGLKSLYGKVRGKKKGSEDDSDDSAGDMAANAAGGAAGGVVAGAGKKIWGGIKKYGGKIGLKGAGKLLGVAGAAYGAYSAYDNYKKGNYGSAAVDTGLAVGGLALTGAGASMTAGGAAALGIAGTALAAIGAVITAPVVLTALAVAAVGTAGYFAYKHFAKKKMTALSKLRYAQYGFLPTDEDHFQIVMGLEDQLKDSVVFKKSGPEIDSKKLDIASLLTKFGVDVEKDQTNTDRWLAWFANRFKPVYLNHRAALFAVDPKAELNNVEDLKPEEQKQYLNVAKFLGGPYGNYQAPFPAMEALTAGAGEVKALADIAEAAINDSVKGRGKTASTGIATAGVAAGAKIAQRVDKANTTPDGSVATPPPNYSAMGIWDKIKSAAAATTTAGVIAPFQAPPSVTTSSIAGSGTIVTQPGNGTAGNINDIPMPKSNGTWAALKDTILAASKMAGVDPKIMAAIAGIESNFNYTVKAAGTSATGLFQFTSDTWSDMLKAHAGKYGIAPGTSPTDPRANALMGAEFLKGNIKGLGKVLKRPITDTDVYIAHFLGLGGASKFFGSNADAIGAAVMPDAAHSNAPIFFKNGTPLKISEIYNLLSKKVQTSSAKFGFLNDMTGNTPATAAGVANPTPAVPPSTLNNPFPSPGVTPTASATPPMAAAMGVPGAVAAPGTTPTLGAINGAAPSSSTPTGTAPLTALSPGFLAPSVPASDLMAQSKLQKDSSAEAIGRIASFAEVAQAVRQQQLNVLIQIRDGMGSGGLNGKSGNVADATQSTGSKDGVQRPVPKAPVSMDKPVYG